MTATRDFPPPHCTSTAREGRILSLDALRGTIMVLMALDHARMFITKTHPGEFWGVPLPVYQENLPFITRLISHPCAPGFFFLMGTGLVLFACSRRNLGWSYARITRFLALRGLILVMMQFVIENPAWLLGSLAGPIKINHPPGGGDIVLIHFGVLYALGASMIVCALCLALRSVILTLIGAGTILLTQFLTPPPEKAAVLYSPVLRALFIPGLTHFWQAYYPLIPWLGMCMLGMVFGKILVTSRDAAYRGMLPAGAAFLLAFVVLRSAGGFGNFHPPASGWIGFLNMTKYPPSLTFVLFTLGTNLIVLALFAKAGESLDTWAHPLLTFGRTALFFYVLHLYLFALASYAFPGGINTLKMYPFWLFGLCLLYPLCRWYGRFKQRKAPDSVWRMF